MARSTDPSRERTVQTAAEAAAIAALGGMEAPASSASTPVNRPTDGNAGNGNAAKEDGNADVEMADANAPEASTASVATANSTTRANGNAGVEKMKALMTDGSEVVVKITIASGNDNDNGNDFGSGDGAAGQQQQQQQTEDESAAAKTSKGRKKAKRKTEEKAVDARITCDEDKDLAFTWICTECREAECLEEPDSPLLVCEGPCARPFHYPCAGLTAVPGPDEHWFCDDCQQKRHQCAVCNEYGDDDEDVFKCDRATCGLYFHENCLVVYENVDVDVVEKTVEVKEVGEDGQEVVTTQVVCRPKFRCPAHTCWCCTGGMPPDPNAVAASGSGDDADAAKEGESDAKIPKKKGGKGRRGKKKKKTKADNAFAEKKEQLFRCLDCPIAYHMTCIPPNSRFHELALLCHEHYQNKLPDLDNESSFQAEVEAKADELIERMRETKRRKLERLRKQKEKKDNHYVSVGFNTFLFGMKGTTISEKKQEICRLVKDDEEDKVNAEKTDGQCDDAPKPVKKLKQVEFCLPCDFQQEVYSKPPMYTHVHGLKYDPSNRPKKHAPNNEVCKCKPGKDGSITCDDHCLNRMVMTECVGDKNKGAGERNPYWNCNAGPGCGNRMIGQRKFAKCRPKREQGKGWGLVAVNGVRKGGLVQEYGGEVIDEATKKERLDDWARDHPNDPNFYVMALEPGWYIDARVKGNLARFINHSCGPNCHLVPTNVAGHIRVAVVALRDIAPGEFLSYDYQFDTRNGDKFVCRCGAKNCRGTMKGGEKGEKAAAAKKSKKQLWAEAKVRYDRDKKFLDDLAADQKKRLNQVGVLVPGSLASKDGAASTVASGPQEKDRDYAQGNRIFLWRNVYPGSDFSSRYWRQADSKKRKRDAKDDTNLPNVDVLSLLSG